MEATLSDKVAALRSFFGVDQSMPLLSALQAMHSSDGQRAPGGGRYVCAWPAESELRRIVSRVGLGAGGTVS